MHVGGGGIFVPRLYSSTAKDEKFSSTFLFSPISFPSSKLFIQGILPAIHAFIPSDSHILISWRRSKSYHPSPEILCPFLTFLFHYLQYLCNCAPMAMEMQYFQCHARLPISSSSMSSSSSSSSSTSSSSSSSYSSSSFSSSPSSSSSS